MTTIRVSEIFGPTIQGEGAQIGRPTVFVRTGGCDYRCDWCDSLYAVLPEYRPTWARMTAPEILDKVNSLLVRPEAHVLIQGGVVELNEILITLSGGNPALQPLDELIDMGHEQGHTFTMETQGTAAPDWLDRLDHLCVSPKPPSSLMTTDYAKLEKVLSHGPDDTILKVVVFDDRDYEYAVELHRMFPQFPYYLQVGNTTPKQDQQANVSELLTSLERLATRVVTDRLFTVRVLPQLHTLIWGNQRAV